MSQFPSPYSPAPSPQGPIDFSYYTPAQGDLLAPARRASILQAVVGTLLLLCGVLVGAVPWVMDIGELASQASMSVGQLPPGMSLEQLLRITYTVVGVVGGVLGVTLLVLSYFLRGGGMAPAVTSLVIEALILLVVAANVIGAVIQIASQPAMGVATLLMLLVPISLLGLNIAWLIGAARNASRISSARQQYQAQFQQYQQHQQAYMQPGGYGMPPQQGGYGYPPVQPQAYSPAPYPGGSYGGPAAAQPSPGQTPPGPPNPNEPPSQA